jgi:dimethylglycine catabolism B
MQPDPAGLVLIAAVLGTLVQAARLRRRWRFGREVRVSWLTGLRGLPHAYFHTVHDVVGRDRYAASMHVLTAGGLVAAVGLSAVRHVLGFGGTAAAIGILAAVAASMAGVGMVAWRRRPPLPRKLTGGRFNGLPAVLTGGLLFLLLSALLTLWPAPPFYEIMVALLGVLSLGTLLLWLVDGPMRHAAAGIVHLMTHARPQRFQPGISADLRAIDLSSVRTAGTAMPPIGVATVADFGWTSLAQFDACVQCGRCQEVCPAQAAGQPLNPKQLIQTLVRATEVSVAGDRIPLISANSVHPDSLWACTTCRACVYECPMLIEHVDAIVDMRRFETLERAAMPLQSATALGELRATDTVAGRPLASRLDWAVDLALPVMRERRQVDVLLWLGEAAFDTRNQRSLRALAILLRHAGVDFAVLGEEELDCGDLARRLGDEVTFQDLAARNIAILAGYRFATILTADPHALHVLRNEYPAFGGRYHVMHHAAFLDDLLAAGRLTIADNGARGAVTYHDPCYLGRYNGEIMAPRRLLSRLAAEVVEMECNSMRSQCCGGGGGAALSDIQGRRRIPDLRMDQARATGAPIVAVACPNCANMLEGVSGLNPTVADLAELVLRAVGPSSTAMGIAA